MTNIKNKIPEMTDPLGKYWNQPKRENIKFLSRHFFINEEDFNLLKNYSTTNPSGVYVGKMWKCSNNGKEDWLLCWYSASEKEGYLDVNRLPLIITK